MAYGRPSPGKWIFVVVVLGIAGGFMWAGVETGFFSSKPAKIVKPPEPPKEPPVIPSGPTVEKPVAEPPKPVVETPKPVEAPKPAAVKITRSEFDYLKERVDKALTKGELPEARKRLDEMEGDRLPDDFEPELSRIRERLDFYLRMISETDRGRLVEPPKLHRFELTTSGTIDAKLITSDEKYFHIETLHGIPTRLDRQRVKGPPKELTVYDVGAVLEEKLNNRCVAKGIVMHKEEFKLKGFFDNPKKRPAPTAMNYFDMADFAVENGLNHLVTLLFDAALKKDPGILKTVHETKAKREIDLLRFYHTSGLNEDKTATFLKLNARYHDTLGYEENRSWLEQNFPGLVKAPAPKPKPIEGPIAGGDSRPGGQPPNGGGGTKPAPSGDTGFAKVSRERPKPPPDYDDWGREYSGPVSAAEAQKHESKGDEYYREGKKHLTNSYEEVNPTGWIQENIEALKWMGSAFEEFDIAQIIYQRMGQRIPASLLDKARETNMIRSMCRKRAVRHE